MEKLKINNVEKISPIIPEKENEIKPIVLVKQIQPKTARENIPKSKRKESKFSLNKFFAYLTLFEEELDSPSVTHLQESYMWETDGDVQILSCRDDILASKLETAVRWHIGNNYKIGPVTTRDNNKIIIDHSFPQNHVREKKVSTRSYCLPPNEESTAQDVARRLHRVYHLPKPVVEKVDKDFRVEYHKKSLAKHMQSIISGMGWSSKVEDNILFVFTGLTSVSIKTEEKNQMATQTTSNPTLKGNIKAVEPVTVTAETLFVITGTKEEVWAEIKTRYENKEFCDLLSEETKNRAYLVSEEYRKKTNAEDYMKSLLDYVQKLL